MYFMIMHEMSLLTNILVIVRDSLRTHELTRLISVKICYGELAQVVPDALFFAFEALTAGTELDGAVLELERIPLRLGCGACDLPFSPEDLEKTIKANPLTDHTAGLETGTVTGVETGVLASDGLSAGLSKRFSNLMAVCPACGAAGGHTVLAGKELYVSQMEAE